VVVTPYTEDLTAGPRVPGRGRPDREPGHHVGRHQTRRTRCGGRGSTA